MEVVDGDKRSSLLRNGINYGCKKFYRTESSKISSNRFKFLRENCKNENVLTECFSTNRTFIQNKDCLVSKCGEMHCHENLS
jgi:hypothetical protein